MTRVVLIVWLTVLWIALWQDVSLANVLGGVLIAVLVVYVSGRVPTGASVIRPVASAHLILYFLSQLVGSTFAVARAVLLPGRFVHPEVVTVELHVTSDSLLAVVAAAITATPGTLAVDATLEPPAVTVHVLDGRDPERGRANVGRLEALVEQAFGERVPKPGES